MRRNKNQILIKELRSFQNRKIREEALEFEELIKRMTERQKIIDSIL